MDNYEDIINISYHKSDKHPHMSMKDRAAQFSPFAALTGYDEEVKKTAQDLQNQYLNDGSKKENIEKAEEDRNDFQKKLL